MLRWLPLSLLVGRVYGLPSFERNALHDVMMRFLLADRDILRISQGGRLATSDFPLTPSTADHFERLTGYYLSFQSVPLRYSIFACISFVFCYSFGLATHICFNDVSPRSNRERCARRAAFICQVLFVFSLFASFGATVALYPRFPNYPATANDLARAANRSIAEMREGVAAMGMFADVARADFEPF
jgi:hypothetical protein